MEEVHNATPEAAPTTGARYKVRYAGSYKYESRPLPLHYAEVHDSYLNLQVREFQADGKESALLSAETHAAELNTPITALEFTSRLGLHLEALLDVDTNDRQMIAEDAVTILDHYVGQVRGRVWAPLGVTHFPAEWVDKV